jgi:DNA-binding HxlR family transcriptional regulator
MRSYGQYCSVAKALDLVGERWTLLIVRELLARGPSRYTDLRSALPGIATNLLADRLRELESAGLVEREDAPPPVATTLFRLTGRGAALEPVITELGRMTSSARSGCYCLRACSSPTTSPAGRRPRSRSGPTVRRPSFAPRTGLSPCT